MFYFRAPTCRIEIWNAIRLFQYKNKNKNKNKNILYS